MEIKSINECLDRIDNMIYDKSLKYMVIDDLELIRNHIKSEQSEIKNIEEKVCILSVFGQINKIIEVFYSDEEKLDEQYNKLRQRVLGWYEMIDTGSPKIDNKFMTLEEVLEKQKSDN